MVKNPSTSAVGVNNVDLIPVSGRSSTRGMAIHRSILAWRMPWTEEPGRLRFIKSPDMTGAT